MKLLLILGDLFLVAVLLIGGMEDYGRFSFNLPLILTLIILAILNIYYLAGGKCKWIEKLLKKKFFKRQKLLKVVLIPLVIFSLFAFLILPGGQRFFKVVLPSSVNYIWYSKINPNHYTETWTGVLSEKRGGCSVQDNHKTQTICERWGEMEKKRRGDDKATYQCYKDCPLSGKSWEEWENICDFINNTCNKQ